MKPDKTKTTVEELECLREQVRTGELRTNNELMQDIRQDINTGHWLRQSQCCGVQGCCDNTSGMY